MILVDAKCPSHGQIVSVLVQVAVLLHVGLEKAGNDCLAVQEPGMELQENLSKQSW